MTKLAFGVMLLLFSHATPTDATSADTAIIVQCVFWAVGGGLLAMAADDLVKWIMRR